MIDLLSDTDDDTTGGPAAPASSSDTPASPDDDTAHRDELVPAVAAASRDRGEGGDAGDGSGGSADPGMVVYTPPPGSATPPARLHPRLSARLKPHQVEGVKFLCKHLFEVCVCPATVGGGVDVGMTVACVTAATTEPQLRSHPHLNS